MKKPSKKAVAPTRAPAKPAAKAPVAAVPVKKAAAPAKKSAAPAKKKAPAVATAQPATFITAQIDIGFGNHLFIRGTGPGLSWDKGTAMECVGSGLWTVAVKNAKSPVVFKVLVNDLSWSTGADFTAEAGQSITILPSF
ncbi:hypothetical protein [Oleiharenicola lentus]|uniref:hypothetical protein n=1 Tax=Oleiharenicola lentus TaxID=2508720 RepID=UPI003F661849